MELSETAKMMCSIDYKERFKAEYYQLAERYHKLSVMLNKWDAGMLPFKPTCPRSLYDIQVDAMKRYIAALEARAAIESIDLTNNK